VKRRGKSGVAKRVGVTGADPGEFCEVARRLMRHPAAPYFEHAARAEAEAFCSERGLNFERDEFGNVLVRLQTAPRTRLIALAAHFDHPGFEIVRRLGRMRWLARFRGGVPDVYFQNGIPLQLMPGAINARLGRRRGKERIFEVTAGREPETRPGFAVWDLENFQLRRGEIHGRACDDLIGVACILATMSRLKESGARVNVLGVLSRAEEVGLHGALAVAACAGKEPKLPSDALVISLETSRELPSVKMGNGVILRVGDRSSTFDPNAGLFLADIAAELVSAGGGFRFQRALMSGGTCEGTAYQVCGFQTGAVCVALGNYHNCAPGNKIKAEYVNLADACAMVDLLAAAARRMPEFAKRVGKLAKRLRLVRRDTESLLRRTAADPAGGPFGAAARQAHWW